MRTKIPDFSFVSFLYVTIIGHLIFAIPVLGGIWLLNLMDVKALFFIIVPIALISIPISAALGWLMAKGSNWVNTSATISGVCGLPGGLYSMLLGSALGFRLFSTTGSIIGAILFYILALALTIPLGKFLSSRVYPEAVSQKG